MSEKQEKKAKKEFEIHNVEPEELLPDNSLLCEFTIYGKPVTKKNHGRIITIKGRGPIMLPSSQYAKYEITCKDTCENAWIKQGKGPMNYGIAVYIQLYLDTWSVGDHSGYIQALGDIFEKFKIVDNDKWIHWADQGKHWFCGVDKDNPRVEIKIYRFRHPYEDYRKEKEVKLQKKLDKNK